jgi:putative FmdB family regulatory protein
MPTYQYRCHDCGSDLEVFQRMTDASLTQCPRCEGSLRKVFSAVGVVFKGSGFYATDSRSKGRTNAAAPGPTAGDSGSQKEGAKTPVSASSSTSESSPAATPSTSSSSSSSSAPAALAA